MSSSQTDTHMIVHLPTKAVVLTGTFAQCMSAAQDWARIIRSPVPIHQVQPIRGVK